MSYLYPLNNRITQHQFNYARDLFNDQFFAKISDRYKYNFIWIFSNNEIMNISQEKLKTNINKSKQQRLMLFDLSIYGHHPGYIQYLLEYWNLYKPSEEIIILVSPRFLEEHFDVVELGKKLNSSQIKFIAIKETEHSQLTPRSNSFSRIFRNFQEWKLFCQYAKNLEVDCALIMYYDTYQYPITFRINPPCSFSAIYFRPTFHYELFSEDRFSKLEKFTNYWQKFILNLVLQNTRLKTLFSLDRFVVDYFNQESEKSKLVYLPDPVKIQPSSESKAQEIKHLLQIEPHRQVFLVFGALTDRKGIYKLLEAIPLLNSSLCEQLAIVFVGESNSQHQAQIDSTAKTLSQNYPIQIIRYYEFVSEESVGTYFQIADVVLALYQNHVGMSGILILAAASQKPVLSSDYGLMGEIVRRNNLGLTIDSTKPQEIAKGLTQFLLKSSHQLCDPIQMESFARQNSVKNFARVIFENL